MKQEMAQTKKKVDSLSQSIEEIEGESVQVRRKIMES